MNTYLMTWNPDNWNWESLSQDAEQSKRGVPFQEPWSCGNTKKIKTGDRLFLLKQGSHLPKGIIASGRATSDFYSDKHWNEEKAAEGKTALYVAAEWDTVLDFHDEPLLQTSKIDDGDEPQVNWNTMSSGISISTMVADRMEMLWGMHVSALRGEASKMVAIQMKLAEESYFEPDDLGDERERKLREIVQRRGQPKFRNSLVSAYNGRCAVTGCDAVDALEAAHITPYLGPESNHVANGLLLRADIHTLFDLNLIRIHPGTLRIEIAEQLQGTSYEDLEGGDLIVPDDASVKPSKAALQKRWDS